MSEDGSSQKVDSNLVAKIMSSYVRNNSVAIDQLGGLIATVHQTLNGLGKNEPAAAGAEEKLAPAVSIRRSVQPDSVACLECGFRGKTFRRHLRIVHGLDPAAYRARWKLAVNYPLTAPAYSAHRSALARQLGLGRPRSSSGVNPAPTPARRARSRKSAAAR